MTPPPLVRRLEVRRSSLAFHGGGERKHQDALRSALEHEGVVTTRTVLLGDEQRDFDLLHVWNLQDPREAEAAARWGTSMGMPVVVTPLDVDRTALFEGTGLARAMMSATEDTLARRLDEYETGELLEQVREELSDTRPEPESWQELREQALRSATLVHCLSNAEATRVSELHGVPRDRIVISGVAGADVTLESPAHARENFVLVPASRIEILKNQLGAVLAARHLNVPFVITGSAHDRGYAELCTRLAPDNVRFVGLRSPEELDALLRQARVVLHPSFLECASLALIEAASRGCSLVASETTSEREYFGDDPHYVDPRFPVEIARAVLEAWNASSENPARAQRLHERASQRTWQQCATPLAAAMRDVATPAMA